jgi:arabinofuranan 3-O-arabinosyltransferase
MAKSIKQRWNAWLVRIGRLLVNPGLWAFLLSPRTRYVTAWLTALCAAAIALTCGWVLFNNDNEQHRRDGNGGHATIDFGGQYLMGRMIVEGHGRHLYDRTYQRQVLQKCYPSEDEDPGQDKSDAENLMSWLMGDDDSQVRETLATFVLPLGAADAVSALPLFAVGEELWRPSRATQAAKATAAFASNMSLSTVVFLAAGQGMWETDRVANIGAKHVGGPLYPPINALLYSSLALLPPHLAYRVMQVCVLLLAPIAGLTATWLSRGRIWWPVATTLVIAFPGFASSLNLGQNAALTFVIAIWGWALIAADRPALGGMVWGLLAFKPVWAAAFFLVPLVTRRWRACLGMLVTGGALVLVTLPFVGVEGWVDWLAVGREGTETYNFDRNWIELSRDLLSLPRRWLDFDVPWRERRDLVWPLIVGWCLLVAALELTLRVAAIRKESIRLASGAPAAFVLVGAWLSCFHFMYYDILLTALPLTLLFPHPGEYLSQRVFAVIPVEENLKSDPHQGSSFGVDSWLPLAHVRPLHNRTWVQNRVEPTVLVLLFATVYVFPLLGLGLRALPYDTFCAIGLWLWCGWLLLRSPRAAAPIGPKSMEDWSVPGPTLEPAQLVELDPNVARAH